MELKDVILSTLAEMEDTPQERVEIEKQRVVEEEIVHTISTTSSTESQKETTDSELAYLNSIRERLLVLFEGFQSPNNANIEAKVDMTLNFLEYTLATIDERVQKLEKGNL